MKFWDESVWLPPGYTWQNFQDKRYAQFSDLFYPIPAAFIVLVLRAAVEQKIFRGLGSYLGLHDKHNNSSLCFWARRKLSGKRLDVLDKFCETGWRWCAYFCLHVLGVTIMTKKPWFWQTTEIWLGYPQLHYIDSEVWWYYMIELSFYWSLFFSQFADAKRKDFVEMFVHHLATIFLLVLSWTCHVHRVGSLVLFVHDFADHWLELAKLGRYAKYQKVCDIAFVGFLSVWVTTRMGVFPVWIIYSITVEAAQLLQMFPMYYVFNFLLTALLVLHLFWTYFIIKAAYKALLFSDDVEDNRSDDEESDHE